MAKVLTENITKDELEEAIRSVEAYAYVTVGNPKVFRALRTGADKYYHRVNTPEKIPALYIYRRFGERVQHRAFVVLQGPEGDSFARKVTTNDKHIQIKIIHGHAINRYIERHHFEGTLEMAQRKILNELKMSYVVPDGTSDTLYIDYDGGVFLCTMNDGILHMRTFIMHRQCKPIQRLRALESERKLTEIKNDLGIKE